MIKRKFYGRDRDLCTSRFSFNIMMMAPARVYAAKCYNDEASFWYVNWTYPTQQKSIPFDTSSNRQQTYDNKPATR